MKKLLGLLLSAALLAGALAGCSGTGGQPDAQSAPAAAAADPIAAAAPPAGDFDTTREITVVSREDGSGTRGAFVELVGVQNDDKEDMTTPEAVVVQSTSVVMNTVSGDLYAIGYISLGSMNDTIKALSVDGVAPSVETVKDGSYKIARPFQLATGEGLGETPQDFIDYILSAEGQAVVEDNGYISAVDSAAPYAGGGLAGKVVVAGSSSVTPVMEKLKEAYLIVNPEVDIEIQMSDSTTGMNSVKDGICDIGMASRDLKDSELEAGLTPLTMAMDGIAVIVHNQNPTSEMTSEQIRAIYSGETLTWGEA